MPVFIYVVYMCHYPLLTQTKSEGGGLRSSLTSLCTQMIT